MSGEPKACTTTKSAAGGRWELAAKEQAEIELIDAYMPKDASQYDISTVLEAAIALVKAELAKGVVTP